MIRIVVVCIMLASTICPKEILALNHYELTFVNSDKELDTALNKGEALKGLAVRNEFYNTLDQKTKEKIDNLVTSIKNSLRPIFIYGSPMRLEILESWFPQTEGYIRCKQTVAGVFSTLPVNDELQNFSGKGYLPGATIIMCDLDDTTKSEQEFRDHISNFWIVEKQNLKEEGYATLN